MHEVLTCVIQRFSRDTRSPASILQLGLTRSVLTYVVLELMS